jgi:hypothetical protein
LADTAALYGRVFRRAAQLTVRNPVMLFGIAVSLVLLAILGAVLARFGVVGGLGWTLAATACVSGWLALASAAIRTGRTAIEDLVGGLGTYLGDLLTVSFILWGLQLIAALVLAPFPYLGIVFLLATLVFFNAVPELVYLGRVSAPELLVASYRFIGENWIEWFPANLVLAALYGVTALVPPGPYGVIAAIVSGVLLTFALLVRGLLFVELTSSGRRARAFKRMAEG